MNALGILAGLALLSGSAQTPRAVPAGFAIDDHVGQFVDILQDGHIVGRYMYAYDTSTPAKRDETYKPYLHIFDPDGASPITKGVGGLYTHHRGVFLGWMKLTVAGKVYDRWHMKGGEQIHSRFSQSKADKKGATITSLIRYTGATGETIFEEERTMAFSPAPPGAYAQLDFSTKLRAVGGETTLGGDPEHAGLHFRPANEVDGKLTSYVFPKAMANAHKDKDYPWVGESFTLPGGKRYSVVFLSHPENPTGTLWSAYRDYGRFGAFYVDTISAGATRDLRARFVVFAGEMPPAETIQKLYNSFAGKNDPTPTITTLLAEQSKKADPTKK